MGTALDGRTWKGPCGAAAAELGQGRGAGGAGKKKTLPFIARLGLLGACGRVGATMAGPGSPPAPPPPPAKPDAHKPPCPGTELLSGKVENTGAALAGDSQPVCGHGELVEEGLPQVTAPWWVSTRGLQLPKAALGLGRGSGMPLDGGSTPRAAEGLVGMTGNIWAQRGRWGRAGLWNRAGARSGGGNRQRWPGLELGNTRCPGCSEHPVELGAALQGHWESPAEGCGDRAMGWGCVGHSAGIALIPSPGMLPKVSRGDWR